ncbi:DHH family phosphoesterase [Exiguobacterium acetylicum]|uniref:DHH family phosphoesterase n=1 Tax=Exiguobacterium TaxID=33986 RepID=UPI00044724DD|nr:MULTISPECIES: DHH family phosphoesterase [Exiguobacterium]EZP58881.1 Diguanylate cyclase and phosphoesterase [Exiguobacterium sp. RIT341]MDQ6468529.1 DHH family phosphoesterase [Exiguobacterium acetylicum]
MESGQQVSPERERRIVRFIPYLLIVGLLLVVAVREPVISAIGAVVTALLFGLHLFEERRARRAWETYVAGISMQVEETGQDALTNMPIGILLYDEETLVTWFNDPMRDIFDDVAMGQTLNELDPLFIEMVATNEDQATLEIGDAVYRVFSNHENRTFYLFDMTEEAQVEQQLVDNQTVIGVIYLDNYDEMTQGIEDQLRSELNSRVTQLLNHWAAEHGTYIKRTASDRYFIVTTEENLRILERSKFTILDTVREETSQRGVQLTLSIGIGCGSDPIPALGQMAQSSLDLALGRGGDQVVIKRDGKVRFYGGKTNPTEKRTRVRARVIANSLRDLMQESSRVLIMGHKNPDMDALGSAIGILKLAEMNDKEAHIVLPPEEIGRGIRRMMDEIAEVPQLETRFVNAFQADQLIDDQTLLVVVDTHKPSLVVVPALLDRFEHMVVIDHHRRGEDFIEDAVLVYLEPYASSTSELVTELIEYQPTNQKLAMLEATALLAGIIVDTKGFALRTGSRTFDAASYLRSQGADTVLVQEFLSQDLETYVEQSHILERSEVYTEGMAIATAEPGVIHDQVLIAQAADQLLSLRGIRAAFVIAELQDGRTAISARSLGDVNVQLIMETLGGGGHLTNAATQMSESVVTVADALRKAIDQYLEDETKGEESE